ncbi:MULTISPECIES: O-antigen polymerase [unclassified Acinetobacter]|uniref:O-antigen polymerase n=1 Tax=unclassified Acinetobacter TaxID=196816 RepID=UPI001F115910|nr:MULTISPECIES: O-antigen polymerase [unclassified Acinetobacter]
MFQEYLKRGFTLILMAQIWFLVIYCLAPIALILSYDKVANHAFLLTKYDVMSFFAQFLNILFYLSFIIGSIFCRYRGYLDFSIDREMIKKINYILIFVGILSLFVFLREYGGLNYVLSNMSQIRSGHADVKSYLGAFFLSFYKLVNLSFFIFFAKILMEKEKQNIGFKILFIVNFFLCVFGLFLSAGRENGISFFISLAAIYIAIKKKLPLKFSIFIIIFTLFYIVFGKTLIFALNTENFDVIDFFRNQFIPMLSNSYNLIMMEFSHQYLSLINFIKSDSEYRYFGDYIYWSFIPFKLLGFSLEDSISYYNTYLIMGRWESIIPPGPVAFGYISLGVVGVVVHGFIVGYIFRLIDMVFNSNLRIKKNPVIIGFYGMLIPTFTYLMSNSDLGLFFQNRVPQILFFLILVFYFNLKYIVRR